MATILSGCCGEGNIAPSVNVLHPCCLICPIHIVVLDDTKGINPKVIDAKAVGDHHSVLKRPGQGRPLYFLDVVVQILFRRSEWLVSAPAVAQSCISYRLSVCLFEADLE